MIIHVQQQLVLIDNTKNKEIKILQTYMSVYVCVCVCEIEQATKRFI
jgi:hypothetical protein